MTNNYDLPPLPKLSKQDEIWCNCRMTIYCLDDDAGEDWVDAKMRAYAISDKLGMGHAFDDFDDELIEQVIIAGLKNESTFGQALQAHEEFSRAQAFTKAKIDFCRDMGHEFKTDKNGEEMCRFCGVYAEEAEESGYEPLEEDDLYLLPQPPHPLAK